MTQITGVLALMLVIIFACSAGLAACAPANVGVLDASPKPTSTATAAPTPDPTPTPTPTPEPTPMPTPTPLQELSFEEESKIIGYNPGIDVIIAAAVSGIYYEGEISDENGQPVTVKRIAFIYLRDIANSEDCGIHNIFNDIMIFRINNTPPQYYIESIPSLDVENCNQNLNSIRIIEAFDIYQLEVFCKKNGIPYKDTDALSKIRSCIETNGLQFFIESQYELTMKEFLEVYLSLPKTLRVPASDLQY